MSVVAIHAACLGLVALDLAIRTWRTQLFLRGLGRSLSFPDVLVQSAIGETASSLTPLRAGGEPARLWTMAQQGVPAHVGLVVVGLELLATSIVIVLTALVLAVTVAPDWWAAAGPGLMQSAARSWPWLAAIGIITFAAWSFLRRRRPDLVDMAGGELAAARAHLHLLPLWIYLANVPLTLANIAARVAILPLLTLMLEQQPPLAVTVVGSFALLYVQAVIPTPAGAGAVELGFLGGAAGNLGLAEAELLVTWRIYTTLIGAVLGAIAAAWRFRAHLLPLVRRRAPMGTEALREEEDRNEPPRSPGADG